MVKDIILQLLIVLFPIGLYQTLFMARWKKKRTLHNQIMIGVFGGVSSAASMLLTVDFSGFLWDMRSVPLIIAILYGGFRSYLIASAIVLISRVFLGWDALLFLLAVSIHIIYSIPPLFSSGKFISFPKRKKLLHATGYALFALFTVLGHLYAYLRIRGMASPFAQHPWWLFVLIALVEIVSIAMAVMLLEILVEYVTIRREVEHAEKLNLISELAASVAHEVRNPLTVVRGFLQLMGRNFADKQKEYLETAIAELDRAEEIIGEYLSFARPQLERVERLDVGKALDDVLDILQAYAHMRGVELVSRLQDGLFVLGHTMKFKQAVMNLVKNAVEAIPDGGTVRVASSAEGSEVLIRIADTGKGMTAEQLGKLGNPFYTTKEKGTGLGLMVTLRLIQAMNGTTAFSSKKGEGTVVTINLPAEDAQTSREEPEGES